MMHWLYLIGSGGRCRRRLRILVERFISGRLCGSFGLSDGEIAKFQDPYEWLRYFPQWPLKISELMDWVVTGDDRS